MSNVVTLKEAWPDHRYLQSLRHDAGYSVEELVPECGLSKETIRDYESGKNLSREKYDKITAKLKMGLLTLCVVKRDALNRHIKWLTDELLKGVPE